MWQPIANSQNIMRPMEPKQIQLKQKINRPEVNLRALLIVQSNSMMRFIKAVIIDKPFNDEIICE